MIDYGRVKGSVEPQEVTFASDMVFISSNVISSTKIVSGYEIVEYEYDYCAYTKDEYILHLNEENQKIISDLSEELEAAKILLGVE